MNRLLAKKTDLIYPLLILLISVVFVFDLFAHSGRPATFDGQTHVTTLAQYSLALKSGDFPAYWLNGFANYGLPIGIVSHQLPSYLGALLNLVLNNPTLAFNILTCIGIFLSSLFFYYFLKIYFHSLPSFLGAFLFTFAPYRILNVYIRGAEPEVFSNIFLPLILISTYYFIIKEKYIWFFPFTLFTCLLALTHPMNLLIYSFFMGAYILFCLWQKKESLKTKTEQFLTLLFGGILSLGMAAYYLLPLNFEIKYFYTGLNSNQLAPNHFLSFLNFFTERWRYETTVDHFTRGNILQTGIIEIVLFFLGLIIFLWFISKKKKFELVHLAVLIGLIYLFFTTSLSSLIYDNFHLLGNIQFPWRMLNGFIFIPPIIAAYIFEKRSNIFLIVIFLLLIVFLRFPQLYGKNFINYPDSTYYFTQKNLHSDLLNTIWSDKLQNYPPKKSQYTIIGGQGKVISAALSNSWRKYSVEAKTQIQMLDYTFYFPGWRVYIDGAKTPIQFQDINYRGLIEYYVPAGKHEILLRFEDSPIRRISKIVSLLSILIFLLIFTFRRRIVTIIYKV